MEKHTKIKTILVAVDFTEKTDSATTLAAHMARRHNARVILFHNLMNFYIIDRTGRQLVGEDTVSKHYKEAENTLELMREHLQKMYSDITFHKIIGNDHIVNSINKIIDSESVDIVITGTAGKQGLREFILGSSSYQILTGIKCSVLMMPEDSYQYKFEKILVPIRVLEKLDEKLEISKLIAEKNNGFIGLLGISGDEHFRDIRKAFIKIRESLKGDEQEHYASFVVSNDKAVEISKASKDAEFDLIILNYQDEEGWKSFFSENFFKQIINNTSVPLLFFKDGEAINPGPEPTGYDITLPFPG
ncbi:Nucleotide-binding universal stress protein, UspA family [Chryseobacterium taichungense]|uniref:Nucleotide-binding universal stress protein, UspA family n=1 Tax=Chryseobacterium taichungense TaxID=295069 RepID=A0A1H7X756_9FLAO|nr:universal stress protein [Chryseobacterium taichungense]SEM28968.1 Nucleotide-binding universal stress protein, UspA family [Chryseobacterium taichungense]